MPSAGPACFLDDELFALNDVACDGASTFPDQTVFLDYLAGQGIGGGTLLVPGAALEVAGGGHVHWPAAWQEALRPFTDKAAYLRRYADRPPRHRREPALAGPRARHQPQPANLMSRPRPGRTP